MFLHDNYVYSMCVKLFTAFDVAVLKLYVPQVVSALKSNMVVISMETNRGKKICFDFFSMLFHTDHIKYTMK